ncbi:dihydrodipicolinate synthase family protein [Streptomyces sp. NBC_01795]|uniref:dihydrodipicolinate synthase family protein n=1 Tax=Streptomyces sp. NBC_01795 TaxID=2975943 RepID=UPI002DDB8DA3|nr:dihydrodipicolinate synthase family protein [Streptomyces sp. NBC_01795]WSA94585.1 dihydrodipicolinate synthase family protein [Streptomyces sp. NBC_01795]
MILLPELSGGTRAYEPRGAAPALRRGRGAPPVSRVVFAAAHVVADPLADTAPGGPAALDWDATLAFRRHLWAHGLGVAEAMDTAQRGMGLDWAGAAELIRRSAAEAKATGGRIACGVGTDQLPAPAAQSPAGRAGPAGRDGAAGHGGPGAEDLARITRAYEEQLALVEDSGAQAILMASRALAATARGPEDYESVYGALLRQTARPVLLHWLGPMFDPALEGYWGSGDLDEATDTFLKIIAAHPGKVDGVKVSLLDADREAALRVRLPEGVRCYTGDDFHYPELIEGDGAAHSDALLGVFDPLAPLAADAVRMLDDGDSKAFRAALDPTVSLARHLFQEPTRYYKTGVVLLAWLAGHQRHFTMAGGLHSARSLPHLARAYELADGIGLFPDPELAEHRMKQLFAVNGVDQ